MLRRVSEERVTLEFLGKQLERVIAENSIRNDLRVLTAIVLRLEGTLMVFWTNCMRWSRSTNASILACADSKKSEYCESEPVVR